MPRSLVLTLLATALLLVQGDRITPAIAGTCASNCGPRPVQFVPGQAVTVEIANHTSTIVLLQRVQGTDPIPLRPGQVLQFGDWGGTTPNLSLVFWEPMSLPLVARTKQTGSQKLRIDVLPGGSAPGDKAVYILDDGRVLVF